VSDRYIAAIGGSAGVLGPLKIFFDHTQHDQISYVILRHLSPTYQSLLKEILSRHTKLEIIEVDAGMPLEKDKVYLLPSDKYMIICNDTFHLVDRNINGANRAVDVFLKSMASEHGAKSIAIILSGAGMDGTRGIQYVKEAGGMVIAQMPSSCEHPSMPARAIASGSVDRTALPEDMPGIVMKYVQKIE
jgi:two-component system CheB/CheR fusion protein